MSEITGKTVVTQTEIAPVVDRLLMLIAETMDYQNDGSVKQALAEMQRVLLSLRRRLRRGMDRYIVANVGLTNVGKSTLLNALLGGEIAPRRNGPCTAAPIEFVYGSSLRATAYYVDSPWRPSWQCADTEAVHRRLAELAEGAEADSSRPVRKVVVELPRPLLQNGLIVADTPGFGAAQLDGARRSHDVALMAYLRDDVSQVFWVVLAEQGIGKREMSFHDQLFADICDDVVVTGCEEWCDDDRRRFQRRYAENFGQRLPSFHFVSGLEGMKARANNDSVRFEAAGIPLLEQRIRELASATGRIAAVRQSVLQLADDLRYWLNDTVGRRANLVDRFWRPDSWYRWLELADVNDLARELTQILEVPRT
jgi:GTP-binding protein EngB required for normal cell division